MPRRIIYIQYTNPAAYPPLEHSSRMLADRGWDVVFLGSGALGGADAMKFPPHPNIRVFSLRYCPPGWRQKLHYARFIVWSLVWSLLWKPDWMYASEKFSCPAALLYSYIGRAKILYHEHDSPGIEKGWAPRLYLAARRRLARRADICVLPNQRRVERFERELGPVKHAVCVWNAPSLDKVAPPRDPVLSSRLRLIYSGTIVPDRLPLDLLDALAGLPDSATLTIAGFESTGSIGYVSELLTRASELGISDRVEYVGTLPHRKVLELCRQCDVGICLRPSHSSDFNMDTMVGASNKPLECLASGLALLVTDLPEWRDAFVDPGYALACDFHDTSSIAEALQWFFDHPMERYNMGERGRQRVLSEWNYDAQFRPILAEFMPEDAGSGAAPTS